MNSYTYQFFIVVLLLCWSCQSNESTETVRDTSDQFTSYNLKIDPPKVKWTDLIDEIKIVGLEETEESLLGKIDNLTITESLIVYGRPGENTMYFFDRNGKFINKFNRKGNGPEEYTNLWGYWLDGDKVRIHDPGHKRVVDYSFTGEFLSETAIPYLANHVAGDDTGLWLDMTTSYAKDSIYTRLVRYELPSKQESYYLQKDRMSKFILQSTLNSFKPYKQGLVFKEFLSDSVYLIQDGRYQPFVHFNFGEEYFWKGKALSYGFQEGMAEIQRSGKVWQISPVIGEHFVFLNCNTNSSVRTYKSYLLDRSSGNQVELDLTKNQDESYNISTHLWFKDRLVVSISPSEIGELLEELDTSQYSFEEGSSLTGIEPSENPVLMWIKFKESLN